MFRAAVEGADPARVVTNAASDIASLTPSDGRRWIIAAGKAAARMAAASNLIERGQGAFGAGIVIGAPPLDLALPDVEVVAGDHPIPGVGSLAAAGRLAALIARIRDGDGVLVLLSGGASSLIAAPMDGLTQDDLARLYTLLLGSGLDIVAMNAVRKRFTRFGAGRLRIALRGAVIRVAALSDVIGDDPATIASGPCEPDPWTAPDLIALLRDEELWTRLPERARAYLEDVARGELPETPKPGDAAFAGAAPTEVLGNREALAAACSHAERLAIPYVRLVSDRMRGDAESCGEEIARELIALRARGEPTACAVWGGETTVRLGRSPGRGGRSQHLALSAARTLDAARAGQTITVLAAGTDGRDGPTDAAGAVVDGTTWGRVRDAGIEPERALAARDSYAALDAAGALLRTGPTGTNVMDVVVGIVRR